MFSVEELFVRDFDDLQAITRNPTTLNLLSASAILRRLLFDSPTLTSKVNRTRRLKVGFEVPSHAKSFGEGPELLKEAVYHSQNLSWKHTDQSQVGLDEFLSCPCMRIHNADFRVKDIITYFANKAGGVHHGQPESESQKILEAVGRSAEIGDLPIGIANMKDIVRVTVDALMPLYGAVRA